MPGPSHRQIDVTPNTGFSKNDHQPRIPTFIVEQRQGHFS